MSGKFTVSHDAALVGFKGVQDGGSEPPRERAENGLAQHISAIYLDAIPPRGLLTKSSYPGSDDRAAMAYEKDVCLFWGYIS